MDIRNTFLYLLCVLLVSFSRGVSSFSAWPGIYTNCNIPGVVALTFDDGPSVNGETQKVLNVLKEKEVTATFFVTGKGNDSTYLDADIRKQRLLRQIFTEGHQIGSHTWSHKSLIDRNRTIEEIREDITRLAITVQNILGVKMTVLRPPFGYINNEIINLMESQFGYKIVRWNLDTMDWYNGKNIVASFIRYYKMTKMVSAAGTGNNSFILLHHDTAPGSAELAKVVIRYVRSKGFRFVTVGECVGVPDYLMHEVRNGKCSVKVV